MFKDNKDFYPTPKKLIEKMISGLDFYKVGSILEPSAGKGDITEVLEEKKGIDRWGNRKYTYSVDCIEKDENLQHILKGKKYRVVHNDFLTFNTWKEYDLIIMNPPFSNGCKHLLKALEMQERNGGAVICLLNAETLKNPCNNDRITLQRKLEDYNANIEFLEDSFMDTETERKTNVEVALVKVQLPEAKRQSVILENLRKAQEQREFNTNDYENNQVVENDFIKVIVNQCNMELEAGIKLIKEFYAMKSFVGANFVKDKETGETKQEGSILSLCLSSCHEKYYRDNVKINEFVKEVRGKYWSTLFQNPKFTGQLTNNLKKEYNKKVEELKEYDFSIYNICQIKLEMQKNLVKGIEETIIALFEKLSNKYHYYDETSKNIHYYNGWKTNKSWIINKKVIIPLDAWNSIWGKYEPYSTYTSDELKDIEKCFNYLDGGLTEAVDMDESLKFAEEYGETKNIQLKYFTVTFYKKGTCHITFNNDELLKKFNIFGSQYKGWLPPSYGKKNYEEMTAEEKAVIKEFDGGENGYNKVVSNKGYYLFDRNNINLLETKTA